MKSPDEKYCACVMQRVAMMRTSLLKYSSDSRTQPSRQAFSDLLLLASMPAVSTPMLRSEATSGPSIFCVGAGWRRSTELAGKHSRIFSATLMFASSMNSSTIWFA